MMPIFLQLATITGESTDSTHSGWIECQSLNWGIGRGTAISSAAGGQSASAPSFSEITLTKVMDKSSMAIATSMTKSSHLASATIELTITVDGVEKPYFSFALTNVFVTGFSVDGRGDRPKETFSLAYSAITPTYTPQSATGEEGSAVTFGYDLTTNKAS